MPAVTYYVMGPFDGSSSSGNVWRHADRWPIPSIAVPFYLTPDRKLIESASLPTPEATFAYQYDPQNPVPTIGGCNLFLESGPKDQQSIEHREDVLVFTSEPLTEDLEVTGRVNAKIYFSSDQSDTDLVLRLSDVYPDGRSILIADGSKRKESSKADEKAEAIDVDLWSTSIVFAKGHRIRVSLTSSNYPRFEKNCHGNNEAPPIANNTVHVGGLKASHITLPIVRRGNTWLVKAGTQQKAKQ
jgi:putative CocE/NonD family hydrolase